MCLYTLPSAKVFTTGTISKCFNLTNGTRKGCPLSPIIFSLAIEPLAATIRSKNSIKGITIGNREHKIDLFADDIKLFPILKTTQNITGTPRPFHIWV